MSFPFQKYILIFLFIVMPRPQQQVSYAQYFTVYLMDLLFNQVEIFYNNILAETSYHLLTSIYYKYSLNLAMSLVTKYYQGII